MNRSVHFHGFEPICHPGQQCDSTDVFRFWTAMELDDVEEEDKSRFGYTDNTWQQNQFIDGFGLIMEIVDNNKNIIRSQILKSEMSKLALSYMNFALIQSKNGKL